MTERATAFRYGLRTEVDRARLRQQIGIRPPLHMFQALEPERGWPPTMCGFAECFATVAANAPWHIPITHQN